MMVTVEMCIEKELVMSVEMLESSNQQDLDKRLFLLSFVNLIELI